MTQTPKLPEKLQVIKDQVVYEHDRYAAIGFDACWSHLAPVIEDMLTTLKLYQYDEAWETTPDGSLKPIRSRFAALDALVKAREVLGE
jgi:hypothetical protein